MVLLVMLLISLTQTVQIHAIHQMGIVIGQDSKFFRFSDLWLVYQRDVLKPSLNWGGAEK